MSRFSRRTLLTALGAGAGVEFLPRSAAATLVQGMSLDELVGRSQHALLLTPLSAHCLSLMIGGRSMIVTETRLRVEGVLALQAPNESELTVRTLGGILDGAGELVHGQAEFYRGQLCVGFLERAATGECWVTGMAQGHYPLTKSGASLVLAASPQLPTIRDFEGSAVKRLVGTRLSEAEQLISEVKSR